MAGDPKRAAQRHASKLHPRGTNEWYKAYGQRLQELKSVSPAEPATPSPQPRRLPNQNLSQQQFSPLLHGSPYPQKQGAVLRPGGQQQANGLSGNSDYVYFTHSPGVAADVARRKTEGMRGMSPHIFEVEPLGEFGDDPGYPKSYRTPAGLKIRRELSPEDLKGLSEPVDSPHSGGGGKLRLPKTYIGQDREYMPDHQAFEDRWSGDEDYSPEGDEAYRKAWDAGQYRKGAYDWAREK